MGKWKEKRQQKKEARQQKKNQRQENKQKRKESRQERRELRNDRLRSKTERRRTKTEGQANGTWQGAGAQIGDSLKSGLNAVGSIFGGGGAEETYEETNEYVPESVASGQTPFTPVGNPTVQQSESKNKTGLYVGIGGGILALILLIVGLKK